MFDFRLKRPKSYILVVLQLFTAGYLLVSGPVITSHWLLLAMQVISLAIGVWAILIMRTSKFNVSPEVHQDAHLVEKGVYGYIRHPMYTAVLVFSIALLINDFGWIRLGMFIALLVVLVVKLRYEEQMLRDEFPGYEEYMQRTWRLIPWVF
jgi:protein-S-isoprenylcysteine O-methyltransferase Ste14